MSKVFTYHKKKLQLKAQAAKNFFQSVFSDVKSLKTRIPKYNQHCSKDRFNFIQPIGRGAYAKVFKIEEMYTKQKFAAKVSSKTRLVLKGAVGQALRERKFLIEIEHDFIVNLRYSFQDKDSLYLIQEHMPGGDLGYH